MFLKRLTSNKASRGSSGEKQFYQDANRPVSKLRGETEAIDGSKRFGDHAAGYERSKYDCGRRFLDGVRFKSLSGSRGRIASPPSRWLAGKAGAAKGMLTNKGWLANNWWTIAAGAMLGALSQTVFDVLRFQEYNTQAWPSYEVYIGLLVAFFLWNFYRASHAPTQMT